MPQAYGQCSLFLHPNQHDFTPKKILSLITELQKVSLISQPLNKQNNHDYFTGDKFLDYIAYMGCAPSIQFEASSNDKNGSNDFCHIKIHHHKTAQLIYNQKPSIAPHCPDCKKPVKNWQQNKTSTTIHCNLCHSTSSIETFNWRKMAGYSRLFIEITDIFPKEAIPQQLLLDKLSDISKTEWLYFYSCQ